MIKFRSALICSLTPLIILPDILELSGMTGSKFTEYLLISLMLEFEFINRKLLVCRRTGAPKFAFDGRRGKATKSVIEREAPGLLQVLVDGFSGFSTEVDICF
jgi:hypothetical protein